MGDIPAETPESRLALLAESIEGSIATVFRQVAMNQFEDRVHNARRTEGELPVERLGDLWIETQTEMLGDAVDVRRAHNVVQRPGARGVPDAVSHALGSHR